MSGLRGMGEGEDWGAGWKMTGDYVGPADAIYGPTQASVQAPTANADWASLASTAISTWGNLKNAELQSRTQIATAPYSAPFGRYGVPGVPSPYYAASPGVVAPGTFQGMNGLLLLAIVGVAAYLLLKD